MKIFILLLSLIPFSINAYQSVSGYSVFNKTKESIKITYLYCEKKNGAGPSSLSQCGNPSEIELKSQTIGLIPFNNDADYGVLITSIISPSQRVLFATDKQAYDMNLHGVEMGDIMQCYNFFNAAAKDAFIIEDIIENKLTCTRHKINAY
ncbi:hypothetical protein [Legionella israelensis]|uniref:Uncharacterized protein n=1 Tax=Legionella israelensis TaxID=454 RepID=A0A0W0VLB6_9GAMM|nr:hypothetical protein [Legionella israelensis]KTD20614.1 hypothetical protein Lisr_1688 [Legionella israelensis]QBS10511.1 hypothetical protein E4T55_12025 [Legionella israelensis]SCY56712.1 hypothetical protein SAMN02746069_02887 [Legionella israelensis DSM 19235]STX57441.1 Uncharacterised protein [Legionella israelensis]STX60161.1 Uncharacterised protein [Legionella israelensis]